MARLKVVDLPDVEELKARVDLRAVVTPDAVIRGDKPTKTLCLWHQESHASLYTYPDHLHCYGCGVHMDLLDFVAWQERLDVERDMPRLLEIVQERYRWKAPGVPPRQEAPPEPLDTALAERFHRRLGAKRTWFHRRGLADWLIDQQLLGYEGKAFTIPVWSARGELLTVRFRRDDEAQGAKMLPKYWGTEGRNRTLLHNALALEMVEVWDFAVVCEGELDALRLYQEGLPAVSCTNGAGGFNRELAEQVMAWDPNRVIVAYDQDGPGLFNANRVARLFGVRGRIATWPIESGKDVTDFLLAHSVHDLVEVFDAAQEPLLH